MTDGYEIIKRLKEKIAELPAGYISKKNIKGKVQYYRQWREGGKLQGKYINADELESISEQIEERKRLEKKLKELQKQYPEMDNKEYETNVISGNDLWDMVAPTNELHKRDLYSQLEDYIYGTDRTRVCAVYGLRRTGKTTMLFQAIAEMSPEDFEKTVYIKMQTDNRMEHINRDLKKLRQSGIEYVFIDEVTLMEDFINENIGFLALFLVRRNAIKDVIKDNEHTDGHQRFSKLVNVIAYQTAFGVYVGRLCKGVQAAVDKQFNGKSYFHSFRFGLL